VPTPAAWTRYLSNSLLTGRYHPLPPRRVDLRKPGGGKRTIGILAVRDRIAQRAVHQVLEPLFDAQFLDCSYGFRPGRSADDAIHRVLCYRQAGCAWAFDGDIAACFDTLDHRMLVRFVSETVRERPVIQLVEYWLDTGVLETDAEVYRIPGAWERAMDSVTSRLRSSSPATMHRWTEDQDGEWKAGSAEWDGSWQRRELLKNLGMDALLAGLVATRPVLEKKAVPNLRRLMRRKGVVWGTAGLIGVGALATTWLILQRLAPRPRGALQGGALSPLLANAYLHRFDQAMTDAGHNLVRFVDDFVVCCPDQESAQRAGEHAARELANLRLRLSPSKSRVVSFDQGFRFLGNRFK
jgi:RNA-directed DNA polymerase